MPCGYYNEKKTNLGDGIYCDYIGGRPGVKYWNCYCNHDYSRCPYRNGDDPYELHPDTKARKKREEDERKAKTVNDKIRYFSDYVTLDNEDEIREARSAYNSLTYEQKAYVQNESKLRRLEQELVRQKEEYKKRKQEEYENKKRKEEKNILKETQIEAEELSSYAKESNRSNVFGRKNLDNVTFQDLTDEEYDSLTLEERIKVGRTTRERASLRKRLKWELKYRLDTFITDTMNPKENPPSWLVIASRIVLIILASLVWYYGTKSTTRIVEWTFAIFSWIQGFSMIVSYIAPSLVKLRLGLWIAIGVDLGIMLLFVYLDYNFKMVVLLLLCMFVVPLVWLVIKLIEVLVYKFM